MFTREVSFLTPGFLTAHQAPSENGFLNKNNPANRSKYFLLRMDTFSEGRQNSLTELSPLYPFHISIFDFFADGKTQ